MLSHYLECGDFYVPILFFESFDLVEDVDSVTLGYPAEAKEQFVFIFQLVQRTVQVFLLVKEHIEDLQQRHLISLWLNLGHFLDLPQVISQSQSGCSDQLSGISDSSLQILDPSSKF